MKKFIQLTLALFLILISCLFYISYFKNDEKFEIDENFKNQSQPSQLTELSKNDLIKNLNYEISLNDEGKYSLTSELSELIYENDSEIVKMSNVIAKIKKKKISEITISSRRASFDSFSYNTYFSDDVKISYDDNLIVSDEVYFDTKENLVNIYKNVEYIGSYGALKADTIRIDLKTNKINISMNNKSDKIKFLSK